MLRKKNIFTTLLSILLILSFTSCIKTEGMDQNNSLTAIAITEPKDSVTLFFTSWRTEDSEQMNRINKIFMKKYPHIEVIFQPITDIATEYNVHLMASLEGGFGADILYTRSYDGGLALYKTGHLLTLNDILPAIDQFPPSAIAAWSTEDGILYSLPSVGVTHGIFYHKKIFEKLGLSPPKTWEELITLCEILKKNDISPFAQGFIDGWTLYEVVFSGLGPNIFGGEKFRQGLLDGTKKVTDPEFIKALKAVKQLGNYFPEDAGFLEYRMMQEMFSEDKAAMFIGGSWEISDFLEMDIQDLGWFPPPLLNESDTLQYCFHVDAGIAMNKNTKYPEEAKIYMKWLASPEYAQLFMDELPGFFSYTPGNYSLSNDLAKQMQSYVADSVPTVRTVWEKLSAEDPSGNALVGEAIQAMYADTYTPKEACEYIDNGLSEWFY